MTPIAADEAATPSAALRLRVLDGRLAGAEHRLPSQGAVRVGHAFENDIVLRGKATRAISIELHRDADSVLMKVVSGEVILLGRAIGAGEEALLPGYLPVRLGDYAFAIGGDDDARWADATDDASRVARPITKADEQPRAALAERAATRWDPIARRAERASSRPWRMVFVALAALALLGAAVLGQRLFTLDTSDPAAVQAELTQAGFTGLTVKPDPGGPSVVISGSVLDDEVLANLSAHVDRQVPGARLDVISTDALAAAATDVLSARGIDAVARVKAAGSLLVDGEYLPADRQAQLTQLLQSDVPGVRAVEYRTDPAKGGDRLRYFFNSPEYGAASFVDGDPGYLLTADGSRWFTGAVLPTGHRIVEVGGGRLLVEKDGRVEAVVM